MLYNFRNGQDLIGQAFFDAQCYVRDLSTIKNYVIVTDMYKSIQFVHLKVFIWLPMLFDICATRITNT